MASLVVVDRVRAAPLFATLLADPVATLDRIVDTHGPFVRLDYPLARKGRAAGLYVIGDAGLYREMLTDTDTWRNVKINAQLRRGHSSNRLSQGLTRMRGERHAHYRRLLAPPLKRKAVAAMSEDMARIAAEQVASWPTERALDLGVLAKDLSTRLAIGLLFGDDTERAMPVAALITNQVEASWIVPGPRFFRWTRQSDRQERLILEWAAEKRGEIDPTDLLSIIANNPDENGDPPSPEIVGGAISFLFGATYETCQNGLAWTLLLLSQHPGTRDALEREIDAALAGRGATIERVGDLPLLDAVIREGMRLLPPVPIQMRKATRQATLGGEPIAAGARIVVGALQINRSAATYDDPLAFRPGRWSSIRPTAYEYTVYGAGGHMCPGAAFAQQMLKIALASIVARCRVSPAPGSRFDYRTRVTLQLCGRPEIVLTGRDAPAAPVPLRGRVRRLLRLDPDEGAAA